MAEGRNRSLWAPTSHVLALLANIHRDRKKSSQFDPIDFDPYRARDPKPPAEKVELAAIKGAFAGLRVRRIKAKRPSPESSDHAPNCTVQFGGEGE